MLPSKTHSGPVVISFWGKGGATKTTASLMLAGVASYLGLGVLVIDTDPQGSAALWRSRRGKDDIAVQTGRPDQLEGFLARAQHGDFDLVLIDNAPAKNAYVSRVAALSDLSIILVRPSPFDLEIGRNWARTFADSAVVVVISAAPALRQGTASPLVRAAREEMRLLGNRVWNHQLTSRHAVIECSRLGQTVIEADWRSAASQDYIELWNSVLVELSRKVLK